MFQGNEESKVCNRTFPPLPPPLGSEVGQQRTCLHLTTDTVGQFITCAMLDTSHVELYNPHSKTETPPTVKKKQTDYWTYPDIILTCSVHTLPWISPCQLWWWRGWVWGCACGDVRRRRRRSSSQTDWVYGVEEGALEKKLMENRSKKSYSDLVEHERHDSCIYDCYY